MLVSGMAKDFTLRTIGLSSRNWIDCPENTKTTMGKKMSEECLLAIARGAIGSTAPIRGHNVAGRVHASGALPYNGFEPKGVEVIPSGTGRSITLGPS
jgi:hypothetical protein